MCGIAGIFNKRYQPVGSLETSLNCMKRLLAHRGPDAEGEWTHSNKHVGFGHKRLSVIDLESGMQPMAVESGNCIVFNGEIYNHIELRRELGTGLFRTKSDTEVILRAYEKWGEECLDRLRGMFAFAIWDEQERKLFCARDRFGIKPFYYTENSDCLFFASEAKALLPFLSSVETNLAALKDYFAFQFCLAGKTLFNGIYELLPGQCLSVKSGTVSKRTYWNVYYTQDWSHTKKYFIEHLQSLLEDSVALHTRSDVPIGGYVSGGLDSGAISTMASARLGDSFIGFTGKFSASGEGYDESRYAESTAKHAGFNLFQKDITSLDFIKNIRSVIYHMDYPVAGPGAFSQFMVSELASEHRKVVLGGQGGDEIFGGYTRYLIAYFEQCIKAAIEGTMDNGNFVVTYESIIPNLESLKNYKPMLQSFWQKGLFEDMDKRYYQLINRSGDLGDEVSWGLLGDYSPYETFKSLFYGENVGKESYFDLMTHFDFKTLLPALLQVEDRMSMAHGLESRVPLLDHPLVECAASIPSDIKFKNGEMKHVFKKVLEPYLPNDVYSRKDKMGFPTPINKWLCGDANEFIHDVLSTRKAQERDLIDNNKVLEMLDNEGQFGRKIWGFLCLELWQQEFHDKVWLAE